MSIETIRTRETAEQPPASGIIDVSGVATADVKEVAEDTDVYFERRGGRTYLIPV